MWVSKTVSSPTWNLSIKGIAPASSAGIDIDKVVGVLHVEVKIVDEATRKITNNKNTTSHLYEVDSLLKKQNLLHFHHDEFIRSH